MNPLRRDRAVITALLLIGGALVFYSTDKNGLHSEATAAWVQAVGTIAALAIAAASIRAATDAARRQAAQAEDHERRRFQQVHHVAAVVATEALQAMLQHQVIAKAPNGLNQLAGHNLDLGMSVLERCHRRLEEFPLTGLGDFEVTWTLMKITQASDLFRMTFRTLLAGTEEDFGDTLEFLIETTRDDLGRLRRRIIELGLEPVPDLLADWSPDDLAKAMDNTFHAAT